MKKRLFDGEMILFYIGWNGFGRALIEGLRTDSLMLGSFRVSQLLGALMAVAAFGTLFVIHQKLQKLPAEERKPLVRDSIAFAAEGSVLEEPEKEATEPVGETAEVKEEQHGDDY